MAERVHPELSTPQPPPVTTTKTTANDAKKQLQGSYIIQLPRDQIYRVPPLENEYHFKAYTSRAANRRRGRCCRCLALTVALLSLLVFSLAAVTGILYLVLRPKLPRYSIDAISIRGLDLSAAGPKSNPDLTLSPLIDVTVRAENPNRKIGIDYRHGSSVTVSYSDVVLCRGIWPSFYQGKRNVTVFQTALKGSGIRLADATLGNLTAAQRRRQVPLEIGVRVPVRVKLGAITSWTINVKVHCDVTVDKLTADSKFISKKLQKKARRKVLYSLKPEGFLFTFGGDIAIWMMASVFRESGLLCCHKSRVPTQF
ncbi:hypothetical protein HPP92_018214 [Vanilla planifolia]|uniref:Late embryogenesis abundant protein LEA-2 subgroup domain-containing protein n=1 Tax=Vanilla planifolia TaxID=51239 RepID=A0A835QBL0_VANPL|nr:hypothetical protein HPP92_018214 [Vanilla planifolia]